MDAELLKIEDLTIAYETDDEIVRAVNDVSLTLEKGETLGLVGETGAGKTTIALSILGLLPDPPAKVKKGRIVFEGENLLEKSEKEMRHIRGNEIAMIFQDPMTTLNPVDTVGEQIAEAIRLHEKMSRAEAKLRAGDALETVGIPATRYDDYPHQFSGGMKQRVVIAMALACQPKLLIADEPTTALDVTIQAQILRLINKIKQEQQTSVILITHDLGVVAEMCQKVAVIYAGEVVECGTLRQVFKNPLHPYTRGLFDSLPKLNEKGKSRLTPIEGLMPDPANLPDGCKFAPRCRFACEECHREIPPYIQAEPGHFVRCKKLLEREEGAR